MKIALHKLITFLSFIFIILPYNSSTGSDKNLREKNVKEELYKVKLQRKNNIELIIFDTTVTLSYLLSDKDWYKGMSNFDRFYGFNYPMLKNEIKNEESRFYNDTITIKIKVSPFDIAQFKKNLSSNKDYYKYHKFYGLDLVFLNSTSEVLPRNEISNIEITVNQISKLINPSEYENLFNANTKNSQCYISEKGEIILTMLNGIGAESYYVVLIFDPKGNLKRKINQSVI